MCRNAPHEFPFPSPEPQKHYLQHTIECYSLSFASYLVNQYTNTSKVAQHKLALTELIIWEYGKEVRGTLKYCKSSKSPEDKGQGTATLMWMRQKNTGNGPAVIQVLLPLFIWLFISKRS